MNASTPKEHPSIRIFKSDLLEKTTHVHPVIPLVMWAPVACYLVWRALSVHGVGTLALIAMMATGLLIWTLTEYTLHRYVFHIEGSRPWVGRFQYIIHGLHHDDASDPTRLVMPPVPAFVLSVILYNGFKLVFGEVWVDPFFAGFLVGYLCYDYTHFAIHHFAPRTRWGKAVKQHHMLHHYVNPDSRYGVSSPLWDHVFGSLALPTRSPRSPLSPQPEERERPQEEIA